MDKIKELLDKIFPSIPFDKKLHFLCGFIIALVMGFVIDPITGLGLAIVAGIGKECYDDYHDKKIEVADAVATAIGGCVGFAIVSLVQYWRS